MIDKQNEIADFLLSQFEDGCASKDDMLDAIYDKYNNDIAPHSVLQSLKDEGLLYDWGEAYYKLTEKGVKAAKSGYAKYKRQQSFWPWRKPTSSPPSPSFSMARAVSSLDGSPRS